MMLSIAVIGWVAGALATTIWATRMPDDDELDIIESLEITAIAFIACMVLWPVFAGRKCWAIWRKRGLEL